MKRTEFEVIVSDGERPHLIQQAGETIEEIRGSYALDEVLASAERYVLQEWGEVLVFMMRDDGIDPEGIEGPIPVSYSFWVPGEPVLGSVDG